VCESARCPNRGECFEKGRAVFLILGDLCTRNCRFCAIPKGKEPDKPDPDEPRRVAQVAKQIGLKHVIITSVTRDDLEDGGSSHYVQTIKEIRTQLGDDVLIEVLTPDFQGDTSAWDSIIDERPTVFNHNLETVPRLYPIIRPKANYKRSLSLLGYIKTKNPAIITKTGIMLGLGETSAEVISLLKDARNQCVDMITIGQYLQASKNAYPVKEYISPDKFRYYKSICDDLGFLYVESGPLIRSSYYSEDLSEILNHITNKHEVAKCK
jgi:lipoic acid synthetase